MSEICTFADKQRGIYTTSDGMLYFTKSNTFEVVNGPLIFQAPLRILTSAAYDPYFVVITSDGNLYLLSHEDKCVVLQSVIPANAGFIESIIIDKEKSIIKLVSTHGTFVYRDHHWNLITEPLEALIINPDTKANAQCAKLENEMAHAVEENSFEAYKKSASTYLVYIATYLPQQAFIATWYDMIHSKLPFNEADVKQFWNEVIGLLSSIERVASLLDELEMSLTMAKDKK